MLRVAANVAKEQSWIADKEWLSSRSVEVKLTSARRAKQDDMKYYSFGLRFSGR
jgi:hypothetical protein